MKAFLCRCHWILTAQCGIHPKVMLRSIAGLPRYFRDLFRFRAGYKGRLEWLPCLQDWKEEGGATKSEYFWQDLLVARKIYEANPQKHVDIGSRVDGFVAHVASFREIESFDVRPITTSIPGVRFKQADFMKSVEGMRGYCDSLSCLHALEHFGLGRYGDPVDPQGFERGLANMSRLLKAQGTFYLSVPVGVERVEFNAHRIFDPRKILDLAYKNGLILSSFFVISHDGRMQSLPLDEAVLIHLAGQRYSLGIFIFTKCASEQVPAGNCL